MGDFGGESSVDSRLSTSTPYIGQLVAVVYALPVVALPSARVGERAGAPHSGGFPLPGRATDVTDDDARRTPPFGQLRGP